MKQVKILAIGNSFSEDATYYLHQMAKTVGIDSKVVNLYIGGCSLETHMNNVKMDEVSYRYEMNGIITERYVSIKEALQEDAWDYITIQQASHDSGIIDSYYPYVELLYDYIREFQKGAKILLHQTWAYERDSTHECFDRYHNSQEEMYNKLKIAYSDVKSKLGIDMIPCGDVIQEVRKRTPFQYDKGELSLCRDGFHMHYIYGRYLLAATWYEVIFGLNILENDFIPKTDYMPYVDVDLEALHIIKTCVHEIVTNINTIENNLL